MNPPNSFFSNKSSIHWFGNLSLGKSDFFLLIILFSGFLFRLYIAFFSGLPVIHRDTIDYFKQADAIINGGYINYFPNGYPFLIALTKMIAGTYTVTVLLWFNIILSTLNIYLVFFIAKKVFENQNIAFIAAVLIAVFPTQINYARWLTTEVPTAFLLLSVYYFYYKDKFWISGLFFGLATVVRTDEAPVFLLLIVVLWIHYHRVNIRLFIFAVIPLLVVAMFCYTKTGQFSIAGHGQVNIMYSITSSGSYVDWYYQDKHPEVNTTGKAVKMYFDNMLEHPRQFVRSRFANLWELWGFFPSSDHGSRGFVSRFIIGASNFFMIFFGIFACWKTRKNINALILIIPFVIATPLHVFLLALPRYTYPVEPFMIILASWTLYRLIFRHQTLKSSPYIK